MEVLTKWPCVGTHENMCVWGRSSPIHSTLLEMSEVSSDAAILLIRVPQQTDAAIVMSAL